MELLIIIGTPIGLVSLFMLPFLRVGIDLADEGYLVFGTSNLLDGQVPIRDFRAYDPGRYYWCALFTLVFGRSFLATRIAMAATTMLSLGVLAALMIDATASPTLTILTCTLAMVWMQPRHKQIENFFVILSLFLLFNTGSNGSEIDFVLLGTAIGISAFFGLNIAAYFFGATLLVYIFAGDLSDISNLVAFGLGGLLGCTPIFAMCLRHHGYAHDYYQRKVAALVKRGSTNLRLPLPWIWTSGKTAFQNLSQNRQRSFRFIFTIMPIVFFGGVSLPLGFFATELDSALWLVFVASCVGLLTFYHTLSRADFGHMFLPALPLSVIVVMLMQAMFGQIVTSLLMAFTILFSVWLVWLNPFHLPMYLKQKQKLLPFQTAAEFMLLPSSMAQQLERIQNAINHWTTPQEPILSVPAQIGLCAMTARPHAAFDSFPVYPTTPLIRKTMIENLQQSRPKLMLIGTYAIDGRTELIFLKNYPEVFDLLATDYILSETIGNVEVYVIRDHPLL
jgi:hypothetical protein